MPRPAAAGAFVLLALALGAGGPAAAWDPPGWRRAPAPEPSLPTSPALPLPLWGLGLFRSLVSPVDGDRCPSEPTCSAYAVEAFRSHGLLLGGFLTAGRLVAESDEAAFAPRVLVGGKWKVYAPLEDDLAFLRGPLAP